MSKYDNNSFHLFFGCGYSYLCDLAVLILFVYGVNFEFS